jgi:hypothetical protein
VSTVGSDSVSAQAIQPSLFDDASAADAAGKGVAEGASTPLTPPRRLDTRGDDDLNRQILSAGTARPRPARSSQHVCLCLIQAIADEMDAEGWQERPASERVTESVARCHQILQGECVCPIAGTCTELARAREMGYIPPWDPGHPGWDSTTVAAECKRRRKERREQRRRAFEQRMARRREGDQGLAL